MQGFLSRDGMSPADLLAAGRLEVAGYGVELVDDQRRIGGGDRHQRRQLVREDVDRAEADGARATVTGR